MKIGSIAYTKNESHLFDPNYSLYLTRKIPKSQKVEIISDINVEGRLTVKILDGELEGEEFRTSIYDLIKE